MHRSRQPEASFEGLRGWQHGQGVEAEGVHVHVAKRAKECKRGRADVDFEHHLVRLPTPERMKARHHLVSLALLYGVTTLGLSTDSGAEAAGWAAS